MLKTMTIDIRFITTIIWCMALSSLKLFANPHLELGPMLGHVGSHDVRIWIKSSENAKTTLLLSEAPSMLQPLRVNGPHLKADTDHNGHIHASNLKPSTLYYYDVLLDGVSCLKSPRPTFQTAPIAGSPTHLRFSFGSCVGREGKHAAAAWGQMAADPSIKMLLMLGDNHYADTTDPALQRSAYYDHRGIAGFRDLAKRTSVYGIWDDHDYGPNNSDYTTKGRKKSLETFKSMWANPAYGEAENPGIYYRFSYGDIDFFMLDVRYYRSPNTSQDYGSKSMLGERQWQWLKQGLRNSSAKLKFIASGSEWQKHGQVDSWTSFKREQIEFFNWIAEQEIKGAILLSGDRHFTAGYQINGRIIEITSGPLGADNYPTSNLPEMFFNYGKGKLYCVYDIDTRINPPKIMLEVHRAGEGQIYSRNFTMSEINGRLQLPTLPFAEQSRAAGSDTDSKSDQEEHETKNQAPQ